MIKRRFYKYEHGDNDAASGESSSSDSEVEPVEASDDSEDEQQVEGNNAVEEVGEDKDNSSSGYESEDSSANEVNLDSSGSEDELDSQNVAERVVESLPRSKGKPTVAKTKNIPEEDETQFEASDYILKLKSVFKCRICPRLVCFSEETINTHLKSKRHARSEKLLGEGRLKLMLNEKGQIEGDMLSDGDSDSEKEKGSDSEKDSDSEKESAKPKRKKDKGRLKQKKRLKQEKALKKAEKAVGSSVMNRKARRKNMQQPK